MPQTFGPFDSGEARSDARRIVRAAHAAWSRDDESYRTLRSLLGDCFDPGRHRKGVDMAFLLPSSAPVGLAPTVKAWISSCRRPPLIGFNVSGLLYNRSREAARNFGLADDYRGVVLGILRCLLAKTDARIVLIPHVVLGRPDSECDQLASEMVLSHLTPWANRVAIAHGELNAAELKWIIGKMDWFCGTRMHAAIAGLSSRVPTVALAYSRKTRGVFETCGQVNQVVDLRKARRDVSECVFAMWECRANVRETLVRDIPPVERLADEQMDEIAKILRTQSSTPR